MNFLRSVSVWHCVLPKEKWPRKQEGLLLSLHLSFLPHVITEVLFRYYFLLFDSPDTNPWKSPIPFTVNSRTGLSLLSCMGLVKCPSLSIITKAARFYKHGKENKRVRKLALTEKFRISKSNIFIRMFLLTVFLCFLFYTDCNFLQYSLLKQMSVSLQNLLLELSSDLIKSSSCKIC